MNQAVIVTFKSGTVLETSRSVIETYLRHYGEPKSFTWRIKK